MSIGTSVGTETGIGGSFGSSYGSSGVKGCHCVFFVKEETDCLIGEGVCGGVDIVNVVLVLSNALYLLNHCLVAIFSLSALCSKAVVTSDSERLSFCPTSRHLKLKVASQVGRFLGAASRTRADRCTSVNLTRVKRNAGGRCQCLAPM